MHKFEIHITVTSLSTPQLDTFIEACRYLQAKPLLIELAQGATTTQPMLGKVVHRRSLAEALVVAEADAAYLGLQRLPVTRIKIEMPANDTYSPVYLAHPGFTPYFEWHGKVPYQQPEELLAVCVQHKAHLSINALKGATATRFVTLREFGTATAFEARVAQLTAALHPKWPLLKQEAEYCLFDTNTALDTGWLPQ
jgi:hypothetical protein